MYSESDGMPQDVDVLNQVLEEHGITAKRLAMDSHRELSTIYRYLANDRTTPLDVFRAAFELTTDFRLLALMTGRVPMVFQHIANGSQSVQQNATPVRVPPLDEWLGKTLDSLEQTAKAARYMGKIIEDGKFDASDQQAAANFKRHVSETMSGLGIMMAAVDAAERKAGV